MNQFVWTHQDILISSYWNQGDLSEMRFSKMCEIDEENLASQSEIDCQICMLEV